MRVLASLAIAGGFLAAMLLGAPTLAADGETSFDHGRLARQALERHIRPGYERLAIATRGLAEAIAADCGRDAAARGKIDRAFDAAVTAWGRIEHIAFGPVTSEQRLERIMFWPDRRGIGARQVAKALRERSPDVLDAEQLSKKSVAMQGLPALELVLFGETSSAAADDETMQFRCAFAKAIATNLSQMAEAIAGEWSSSDGFVKGWLSPGPGNPNFLKPEETTLALAKAFDLGLEKVRDQRVGGPLGLNAQRRKIPPVLGKSGRSMRMIVANIDGLRDLYVQGGMEDAFVAAKSDNPENAVELARLVSKELATAHKTAAQLMGIKGLFEGAGAQRVIALGFPLKNARSTAAGLFAAVTDMPLGFNASDGD